MKRRWLGRGGGGQAQTGGRAEPAGHLLLLDGRAEVEALRERPEGEVTVWRMGEALSPGRWASVTLRAHDAESLGRLLTALPRLGRTERVACELEDGFDGRLEARLDEGVGRPTAVSAEGSPGGRAWIRVTLAEPAPARRVLLSLGAALRGGAPDTRWPTIRVRSEEADLPPAAPMDVVAPARAQPAVDLSLDEDDPLSPPGDLVDSVTGRPPVVVRRDADAPWSAVAEGGHPWGVPGPVVIGPVDDRVFHPRGFRADDAAPPLELEGAEGGRLLLTGADGAVDADDLAARVCEVRRAGWVVLTWRGGAGPVAHARAVAALAMCGVPLVSSGAVPAWARALLAPGLVDALTTAAPGDEDPSEWRERVSVRQRRAAHAGHAPPALRDAWAELAGLAPRKPTVSVVLATRRPDLVAQACAQVEAQRNVEVELILARHGFQGGGEVPGSPGPSRVDLDLPSDTPFGTVLNIASLRAGGDWLLKMDDDDWYGPDFIADLVLAQRYSAAEVTGVPPEFWYLEGRDTTVRHRWTSEVFVDFVAGGSLLVDRRTFAEVGGFRPLRRHVDAALLRAVRESGGRIYRTHGLGYHLRRGAHGHTWLHDDDDLVDDERTAWVRPGFVAAPMLGGTAGLPSPP